MEKVYQSMVRMDEEHKQKLSELALVYRTSRNEVMLMLIEMEYEKMKGFPSITKVMDDFMGLKKQLDKITKKSGINIKKSKA